MKFHVYCHTNQINGKSYVGLTSLTIEERWKKHCQMARGKSGFYFHNAIRKYGEDLWTHELLETKSTLKEAQEAEIFWIALRKSFAYDTGGAGYNESRGGEGSVGTKRTAETRKLISNFAKMRSPELRYKIGSANRGKRLSEAHKKKIKDGLLGHRHSDATKKKMSLAQKGKSKTIEHREKISKSKIGKSMSAAALSKAGKHFQKSVLQFNQEGLQVGFYPSIRIASDTTGITATLISRCCRNKRKHAGNYKWEYAP